MGVAWRKLCACDCDCDCVYATPCPHLGSLVDEDGHVNFGPVFGLQLQSPLQSAAGRTLHVRLTGVIANTGRYPGGNTFVLISFAEYQAASPSLPLTYESVDITTQDQAHTDQAIRALPVR